MIDAGSFGGILIICALICGVLALVLCLLRQFRIIAGSGHIFICIATGMLLIGGALTWASMFPWEDIGAKADNRTFEFGYAFYLVIAAGFLSTISGLVFRFDPQVN